jgi:hypothetical protein
MNKSFPPPGFIPVPSRVEGIEVFQPAPRAQVVEQDVVTFTCPNCGATTQFDAKAKGLVCAHCGFQDIPGAVPLLRNQSAEICRQACGADHIRNFAWTPEFQDEHWTLLLLPSFTTYYLDDQKIPQSLLIHGQTGRLVGVRRASMLRARNTALWIAGIALATFVISLFVALGSVVVPVLLVLSTIGWAISILLGAGAIIPLLMVWWTNRSPNSFIG